MIMERKPLVVVPGLVRRDAIAYLQEHVDVRQWTEKTKCLERFKRMVTRC